MKATYLVKIYGPKDEVILLNFDPTYKERKVEDKESIVDVICSMIKAVRMRLAKA